MVLNGDNFKEISLSSTAVTVLTDLNNTKNSDKFDQHFLTALLIGLCTKAKIKENDAIEKGILELVSELFNWRVKYNEIRVARFNDLVTNVIKGIKSR